MPFSSSEPEKKLSREERKIQLLMKQFEQMEKNEQSVPPPKKTPSVVKRMQMNEFQQKKHKITFFFQAQRLTSLEDKEVKKRGPKPSKAVAEPQPRPKAKEAPKAKKTVETKPEVLFKHEPKFEPTEVRSMKHRWLETSATEMSGGSALL